MKSKKLVLLVIISLVLFLLCGSVILANEDISKFIDPNIPDSWYKAPQTASELGITKFNQAPMLEERVLNGEIPPLEQRLPDDPIVIEPYDKVGKYGGTITVWHTNLDSFINYDGQFAGNEPAGAARAVPDGTKMVPYLLKDWKFSDDYKEVTLYLRKGLKYSNGNPFTADDYMYWWEHVANNKDLYPISPQDWKPIPLLDVKKIDDYSVKFIYGKPYPKVADFNFGGKLSSEWMMGPAKFMEQFHPDFVSQEKLEELLKERDLGNWYDLYYNVQWKNINRPDSGYQRPVLRPYIVVKRELDFMILERNPYFFCVDTEGNQLPYIDRIIVQMATNPALAAAKAVTGEADYAARHLDTKDIPLYTKNEEKGGYKTLIYYRPWTSDCMIYVNLAHKDEDMRNLFQNVKFRQAISLAVDRDSINKKVYFGEALPQQAAVPPTHSYYKEEYAKAYAQFDLERSRELLDEIGAKDQDGDGYRELPNGDKLRITWVICKMGAVDPTPIVEIVANDLSKIGLSINLKNVSEDLLKELVVGNNFDMSCWTGDMMLDLSFGSKDMGRMFAPVGRPHASPWPAWVNWYTSSGKQGLEPPEQIKQLIAWNEEVGSGTDEKAVREAGEKLCEAQAKNLWVVGTVTMAPQPIIVSKKLKNVPQKGLWDSTLNYMTAMFPCQFYLEGE